MTLYRFTVSYEDTIEAPDADSASEWAREDVEAGRRSVVNVEVEPVTPGYCAVCRTADPQLQEQRREAKGFVNDD